MTFWIGKSKNLNRQVIALLLFQAILDGTRPYAVIRLADNSQN